MMNKIRYPMILAVPLLWACGSSMPEPKQATADAEAASRSAREVGADAQPAARLRVQLADEQIAKAKVAAEKGDNERATYLLLRAKADAELALALAREQNAITDQAKTAEKSAATLKANEQGAKP